MLFRSEILDAIASIREAQLSTGSVRNSSVRVVLPDGIVLEQAAGATTDISLFESADNHLALLVDGWAVTGFELLVGWRLLPDARALFAGRIEVPKISPDVCLPTLFVNRAPPPWLQLVPGPDGEIGRAHV